MNLWLRLGYFLMAMWFRKPLAPLDVCETRFRCWPTDLDVFKHMNNGKYLTIMDLGRLDLMVRTGLWRLLAEKKLFVVVEAQKIRYRKSLLLFDKFKIQTRILGWDEKSFFIEQTFWRKDVLVADAIVKGRILRKSRGTVPPGEVVVMMGVEEESPVLEEAVLVWNRGLVG